jgi:protein-tyrosine kinase
MSRVHEALQRAAAAEDAAVPAPVSETGRDVAFRSPWRFEGPGPGEDTSSRRLLPAPGAAASAQPRPAPVGEPGGVGLLSPPPAGPGHVSDGPSPRSAVRIESLLAMKWPQPFAASVAEKLVVTRGIDGLAVEQYRRLAARLERAREEGGAKLVLVTSARPGEGKTLTAMNLSLTLSEEVGRRVLLVDANLREPGLHQLFQVSAGRGVSGGLAAAIELTRGLVLLPGGKPVVEPAEVLGSERTRDVLAEARASFDWIIVDAASLLDVPDARPLIALADLAILVADAGMASRQALEQAVELIGRDRLAGVVLNRANGSAARGQVEAG